MVKIEKLPYCACIDLHAELVRVKLLTYGGFETSSDLKDPLQIGGLVSPGGKYDCWSHNFKKEE